VTDKNTSKEEQLVQELEVLRQENALLKAMETRRKRADEAFWKMQERVMFLADVIERSSQPFAAVYPGGYIMTCNKAYCDLTGYTKEELQTISWDMDLTPREWREHQAKMLDKMRCTGEPVRFQKEYQRKDGTRIPVELLEHQVCNSEGIAMYYYAFVTDITERERLKNELQKHRDNLEEMVVERTNEIIAANQKLQHEILVRKKAEEALQEQYNFLQRLIESIPNPIFYKDTQGVYQECNTAYEVFVGLPKDQIIGKKAHDIAPKNLADAYEEMDSRLLQNPGVQVYEGTVLYADGTTHDVVFNKATYTNTDGVLAGIIGIVLDITDCKRSDMILKIKSACSRKQDASEQKTDMMQVKKHTNTFLQTISNGIRTTPKV
jgi:PAS domain S-box-containing protein